MTEIMEVSLLIQAIGIWMIIFVIYTGWDLPKIRAMIREKSLRYVRCCLRCDHILALGRYGHANTRNRDNEKRRIDRFGSRCQVDSISRCRTRWSRAMR